MKCKSCKRDIPDHSTYCLYCGTKLLRDRDEIKVPKPKQLPSGTWFAQLTVKGKRVSVSAASEGEWYIKARAIKAGLVEAAKAPERLTLKTACDKYIEQSRGRLRPSVAQGYESIVENSFQKLMSTRLDLITDKMCQAAVDEECKRISVRGKPYAPKTIANRWMFIATVLHQYVPALRTDVRLPEVRQNPVQILTPEQVYSAVKGTEIELPVLLSMWLSFSMSELRGLTKSKSISNGQISVVETVVDIKGKPVRDSGGKEEKRTRTLDLPPYIAHLIDQVEGDVIVPFTAQALSKRFYAALERAGLPHIAFHKLRHINASVMAELNISDPDANARGGWKTDHVRKQVYTHSFSASRKEADRKIDEYFDGIITNESTNG